MAIEVLIERFSYDLGDGGLQNSKSPDFIFPEVVLFCSYLSL